MIRKSNKEAENKHPTWGSTFRLFFSWHIFPPLWKRIICVTLSTTSSSLIHQRNCKVLTHNFAATILNKVVIYLLVVKFNILILLWHLTSTWHWLLLCPFLDFSSHILTSFICPLIVGHLQSSVLDLVLFLFHVYLLRNVTHFHDSIITATYRSTNP